jgi:YidC/Oxa1 family membrane protein insertase
MDKRTIIFVLALSLTLFGVNQFFQYQNIEKRQAWANQQQAKELQNAQRVHEEIIQRTAPLDTLPIVKFYNNLEQQEVLGHGVIDQNSILTLSWSTTLPKTIFAQIPTSDQVQALQLVSQGKELGTPVVYQTDIKTPLQAVSVPSSGRFDIQLVNFNEQGPQVSLGNYTDGNFSLLLLKTNEQSAPQEKSDQAYTAIALFKTAKGYFPIGLLNATEQRLVPLKEINSLQALVQQVNQAPARLTTKAEEKFYVLETPYQQLVFSNYGGALAEINLPFQSETNTVSVVKEIEFDRDILAHHPANSYFPSKSYFTSGETSNDLNFHEQGALGGYYPLLRRSLIEKAPRESVQVKPQYYALNIVSEYPEMAETVYEVTKFDQKSITFETVQHNRRMTKEFSLKTNGKEEGPYILDLVLKVDGDARGLWLTSGVPEVEWISGATASTLKYRLTRNQKSEVLKIDLPTDTSTVSSTSLDWICNSNGFLGTILDPLKEVESGFRVQMIPGTVIPSRLTLVDQEYDVYKASAMPGYATLLPLKAQGGLMEFRLFGGPFDSDLLKQVDAEYSNPETDYNPDYLACQTMHGWFTFISEPFAKFLFILMKLFHSVTTSWALSIILLTFSLRLMLYPLNAWSTKSMAKMQQIGPEVTAIQERYKKDPKKAQAEVMNLYRERGVNPVSGCLPLLIQMPFLIGMFDLLKSSFALRGASFIPGWIDDLTAPDVLFSWSRPVFFFGTAFHLLPFLLGLVMFAQQKLMSTAPKDPNLMTDQQRQQKAMGSIMALVFAVMFYHFPSGLNIYWLSSMLLGMGQQWMTTRQLKNQPPVVQPVKQNSKKSRSLNKEA